MTIYVLSFTDDNFLNEEVVLLLKTTKSYTFGEIEELITRTMNDRDHFADSDGVVEPVILTHSIVACCKGRVATVEWKFNGTVWSDHLDRFVTAFKESAVVSNNDVVFLSPRAAALILEGFKVLRNDPFSELRGIATLEEK